MSRRIEKINELIREHLSQIFQKELSLKKGVLVTIFKVDTARDLSQAKVYLSIFPFKEKQYVLKTLQKEIFGLQKKLNEKMQTKILPKIIFLADDSQEKLSDLEKIFEKIKKEK